MTRLILASGSPRRRELLGSLGFDFAVIPADVDERVLDGEPARQYVLRVAGAKAAAIPFADDSTAVLGADTTVVVDGAILGKPVDEEQAAAMLGRLSGRWHNVHTAAVVRWRHDGDERRDSRLVTTAVQMRELSRQMIADYARSGEPMDRAGAYAIQGGAASFVTAVRGSRSNVIGLPLDETRSLLGNVPGLTVHPAVG